MEPTVLQTRSLAPLAMFFVRSILIAWQHALRLPKINVELAGMPKSELSPSYVRLLRKEYVSLFQLGHNNGVPLDFLMMDAFAVDHLNHTDEVGRQALEADYCVSWIHVALKPIRHHSTFHSSSLPPSGSSCMCHAAHASQCGRA